MSATIEANCFSICHCFSNRHKIRDNRYLVNSQLTINY